MDKKILCGYVEEAGNAFANVIEKMVKENKTSFGDVIELLNWAFLANIKAIYHGCDTKNMTLDEFFNCILHDLKQRFDHIKTCFSLEKGKEENESCKKEM